MINIRKILYATDFSSYSNQAYFHAIGLTEYHQAQLIIAHVRTVELATSASTDGEDPPGPDNHQVQSYWRNMLEQIRPLDSRIHVEHVLLDGDPAAAILNYAAEMRIDLIVMGTHGRSGIERLLLGSVAEEVLRGAHCPVLVAKIPQLHLQAENADSEGILTLA